MHIEQWLKAGGYVLDQDLPDIPVDRIDARVFVHPAIPSRQVVRLTPDSLASGEDSAMELFGFVYKAHSVGVAVRMRQALGFPDWVLVNHPADAKRALSTARDLKKRMRGAKSKPGNARDLVAALAKDLEKTHPYFLPSLYEEIARMFVEAGNTNYASTFFGKAREAEQMYALTVDEDRRRDAFVEFALNGALTNKVMTEYAKILQTLHSPDSAYAYFYDLCVRRTLGGTPASAQMVTDARKMAKAAGKNAAEEDERFVRDVWECPALAFSARKFWELYASTYTQLAKTLPGLKGRLLNLFPRPSSSGDDFKAFWIGFLGDVGALDAVTTIDAAKVPEADRPEGSAAAWFEKLSVHKMTSGWGGWGKPEMPDEGFALLRKMAGRLRADGEKLKIPGFYNQGDVDLVDLALELEIPLGSCPLRLDVWHNAPETSKERRRDLSFLGADPQFAEALDTAVGTVFSNAVFQLAAQGKKGLIAARRTYLERRIEGLERGFIQPWMPADTISSLTNVPAATFAEFPELLNRASQITPVPALMRSIELGLMQEIGWPEYDKAYAELEQGNGLVMVMTTFPYVYVYNLRKAIVLGPGGRLLEHDFDFKVTNNYQRVCVLRYANKQLFVAHYTDNWATEAYWSGNPQKKFEFKGSHPYWDVAELPDGRIFEGERAFGPPDPQMPDAYAWRSDGTTFWRLIWDGTFTLQEIDPETGRLGRKSTPTFFEEFASPDHHFVFDQSVLYKVPNPSSLFGSKDGLWGMRVRSNKTTDAYEFESILGDRSSATFAGALTFPGTSQRRLISTFRQHLDGSEVVSQLGYRPLATTFLHLMCWRDEKGSEALRKVEARVVADWVLETVGEALSAEVGPKLILNKDQIEAFIQRLVALGASKARAQVFADALKDSTKPKADTVAMIQGALGCNTDLATSLHQMLNDAVVQFNAFSTVLGVALAGPAGGGIDNRKVFESLGVLGVQYNRYSHDTLDLASILGQVNASLNGEPFATPVYQLPEPFLAAALLPGFIYWAGFRSQHPEAMAQLLRVVATCVNPPGAKRRILALPEDVTIVTQLGLNPYCSTALQKGTSQFFFVRPITNNQRLLAFECANADWVDLGIPGTEVLEWVWPDEETLESWAVALETTKVRIDEEVTDALSKTSGLTKAEAAVVWTAGPGWQSWEKNFLPKELRESLGLKVGEADAARQSMKPKVQEQIRLTSHLWLTCADLTGVEAASAYGQAWKSNFGSQSDLLDSEVAAALEALTIYNATEEFKAHFGEKSRVLVTPKYHVMKASWGLGFELHSDGLHEFALTNIMTMIFWLGNTLPSRHPVRAKLREIGEALRVALHHEDQIFRLGTIYGSTFGEQFKKQIEQFNLKYGKVEDEGLTLAIIENHGIGYFLRSHRYLKGERNHHFPVIKDHPLLKRLDYIASDDFKRNLEWFAAPLDGCMFNPAEATPELVEKVSDTLKVSRLAAQLYLQTLALPDVRSSSVKAWNGWDSKIYKSACEELAKAGHLVEAKRARAGRNHFIDGPWLALKAPHLPIEAWKEPMVRADANSPLMPLEPLPNLFQRAWTRVESGDKPGFS